MTSYGVKGPASNPSCESSFFSWVGALKSHQRFGFASVAGFGQGQPRGGARSTSRLQPFGDGLAHGRGARFDEPRAGSLPFPGAPLRRRSSPISAPGLAAPAGGDGPPARFGHSGSRARGKLRPAKHRRIGSGLLTAVPRLGMGDLPFIKGGPNQGVKTSPEKRKFFNKEGT